MKTSKRILSFFMAVVMALTACSAGFVAFARETNPKDNNPFSDEYASAEKSADALNELLNSLLPTILDAIGEETLASIGIDAEKVKNAQYDDEDIKSDRFFEFISELSVFLFDKVGKTSMDKVLADEGLSSGNAEEDTSRYAYLANENAEVDFWTLYNICKNNADENGTPFQQRCNDYYNGYEKEDGTVVTGLKDLLFAKSTIDSKMDAINAATTQKIVDIAKAIGVIQNISDTETVILNKTPAEIQKLINTYEAANGTIAITTDEYDFNIAIDYTNKTLSYIKSSATCSSLADLIFYQVVDEKAVFASIYNAAATAGGANTGVAVNSYDTWYEKTLAANPSTATDDISNGKLRQQLAEIYAKTIISDLNNLENANFYSEYIEGLLLAQGYSAEEIADMINSEGLTEEDKAWLTSEEPHPCPQYRPTAEDLAKYPNAKNNGALKNYAAGPTSFQNTLVFNIADRTFSNAVNRAFGKRSYIDLIKLQQAIYNKTTDNPFALVPDILADIELYAHTSVAANVFGNDYTSSRVFNKAVLTSYKDNMLADYSYDSADYPLDQDYYFNATASVIDGYIEMAKNLNELLAYFGVNLGSMDLNGTIDSLLPGLIQTKDENGNPLTYELIIESVDGIYSNLAKDPMGTIANVVPLLAILIDELIVPLVFNGDGDAFYQFLDTMIISETGALYNITKGEGIYKTIMAFFNEYGITTLSLDLNYILPAVTEYIANGSTERATKGFYEGVTTTDGRQVPIMTTIRYVDELIAENAFNCKFTEATNADGTLVMDKGVGELLKTILGVLNDSVIEYVDSHNTNDTADARIGKQMNGREATLYKGLNNITVALPKLIDSFVTKLLALYNTQGSDWQFDSRIAHSTGTVSVEEHDIITTTEYGVAENVTLTKLKAEIFNKKASNVTSWIVNLLVGDWINAIIDLLNDVFTTDNDITNNIPIIATLLNSLGGFGEGSIVSDALNGLFYLTRNSKYSFAFSEQEIPCAQNGETYVGLSNDSAYYLIANAGPIIEIIMDIVNANKQPETPENPEKPGDNTPIVDNNENNNTEEEPFDLLATIGLSEKELQDVINEAIKLDTKENAKKTQKILDAFDNIISTILKNTYLNGYSVDKLDGILSGVVAYLINHFGKETTDEILDLVVRYLEIICNESIEQKWAPKRNGASNGPVNAKKVYTNKELSILVTETYALLEEILDKVINIPSDDNDYIVNAIDGIFSPSSIAYRAELDEGIMDNLTWCELSATKYSTDLGFDFKAGDKEGFYNSLFDALAPVTAVIGALLSADTTNYYNTVLTPIFASICDAADIELYKAKDNSNSELVLGTLKPIADFMNKFLEAPANTLVSLVNGISGILEDQTVTNIIIGAITPLEKELNGIYSIIAVLSPSLADSIKISDMSFKDLASKLGSVKGILPQNDVIVTVLNLLVGTNLPPINFGQKIPNGEIAFVVIAAALGIVLKSDAIRALIPENIAGMLDKISVSNVLNIIDRVLSITQNPTEVYWTFEDYLAKETNSFKYPSGITASEADDAVDALDNIVKNVFPLLKSLDVLDYDDLPGLVNGLLFKNEMLTKLASALCGALNISPKALAGYLVDKSYGNTYSDAAAALSKCNSWDQVKSLNWGFKDGSAKAEQGFVNGLAAVLRPLNDVLAVLLAGDNLEVGAGSFLGNLITNLSINSKGYLTEEIKDENGNVLTDKNGNPLTRNTGEYSITLKNGMLNIYIRNGLENDLYNRIEIDLNEILGIFKEIKIYGGNGYQSAIIPLLEAFMCDGVKTYDQYINDYNKAKDNLLLNILNPIIGFVDKALANPFDTITAVLPNVAYFIENNGIAQLLNNLLSPITHNLIDALTENNVNIDDILAALNLDLGKLIGSLIKDNLGADVHFTLKLSDLNSCDIQNALIPLINAILKSNNINITLPDFDWATIASHGTQTTFNSAAGGQGIRIVAKQGETLVAVLRYIADALISNASEIKALICNIPDVAKNKTIVNILTTVFNQISGAHKDDIVKAIFYLLTQSPENSFFDYRDFKFKDYDFSYPSTVDVDFLTTIGPMLDGLIGGLVEGGLNQLISGLIYKDDIISSLVCGLYGAVEGVKINDNMNLSQLLAQTDIDFTTAGVAKLLTDKDYGQSYSSVAKTIEKAGSWSKVNKESLHWGVTDRDSFVHALCAALRPIYGVLDVLLNDGSLGLFKLIYLPGSDGYTSAIVPLMEAFGLYNIKTQYQYRQDMSKEYDAILLDILNPLLDKVEDILNAPIQMLCDILPNLSLFFANDGLLQLIDNLLLPISALLDSLKPIVDVNDLLKALGLDIEKELSKLGLAVKGFKFDIYDLSATLKPLIGSDNIVSLLNKVLGLIKVGGSPLGIELMPIDWFQLASHGELITDEASQAATFGSRMYVKADQSEVLIAVLRYLINTINYGNNFNTISNLIGGLLGNASDSVSDMISKVLGMLTGDTDEVISSLCELLKTLA